MLVASVLELGSLCLSLSTLRSSPISSLHHALYLGTLLVFTRLTYLNHHTSRTSVNLILVFWPAYAFICAIRVRTICIIGISSGTTHGIPRSVLLAREAFWMGSVGLGLIDFVLELYSPEKRWQAMRWGLPWNGMSNLVLEEDEEEDSRNADGVAEAEHGTKESPMSTANIYERLTFSWLNPLLSLGTRKFLGEEDMWSFPPDQSAEALSNRLQAKWDQQLEALELHKKPKASLKIAIAQAYGGPYLVAGLLIAIYDCLSFVQPQLLRLLLSYVSSREGDHPMPLVAGYAISILMFLNAIMSTALMHQYVDGCFWTSE
jgi:hypothetical protein